MSQSRMYHHTMIRHIIFMFHTMPLIGYWEVILDRQICGLRVKLKGNKSGFTGPIPSKILHAPPHLGDIKVHKIAHTGYRDQVLDRSPQKVHARHNTMVIHNNLSFIKLYPLVAEYSLWTTLLPKLWRGIKIINATYLVTHYGTTTNDKHPDSKIKLTRRTYVRISLMRTLSRFRNALDKTTMFNRMR